MIALSDPNFALVRFLRLLFEKLPPEILVNYNISKNGFVCDVFAFRVR